MKSTDTRWFDLDAHRVSRRDFVRITRDAAACIALGALPASRGLWTPRRSLANPFPLGVASGEPLEHGIVLWTRVAAAAAAGRQELAVNWELAEDDGFKRIVKKGSSVAPGHLGYSVHVEVSGLEPGRDYWYRFNTAGESSATGHTRTAPRASASPDTFRFAFVSCQNFEHGYFTAYRHLAAEDLDLVVHLGDYIYEKRFAGPTTRQNEMGEVFTLADYRGRYTTYKEDRDLQAAHAAFPWIVTSDDHEVSNNYANDIAERDTVPPARFLLRRAAAYQAYYEFMPLRKSALPKGPRMELYRRFDFGDLLEFNVLDTRQYRSDQACGDGTKALCPGALDSARTMMGPKQEQWLSAGMRKSRARWNVLANQVMIAQNKSGTPEAPTFSMDQWTGYPAAQKRLLDFLGAAKPSNPIVITGDIHSNWVADLKADFNDPASAIVGVEFVGTSITSGGDGSDSTGAAALARNPHIKFYNGRRGYVRAFVTKDTWTSDYRTVPFVTRPDAPVETKASFVVENGRPGVRQV
jgi:alkaline phosphatase D